MAWITTILLRSWKNNWVVLLHFWLTPFLPRTFCWSPFLSLLFFSSFVSVAGKAEGRNRMGGTNSCDSPQTRGEKVSQKSDFSPYTFCFSLLWSLFAGSLLHVSPLKRDQIKYTGRGVLRVCSFTDFLVKSLYFFESKRTFPPATSSSLLLKTRLQT